MKPQDLKFDPDVKIPAAVKAASARSDELFRTLRDTPPEEPEVTPEGNDAPELEAESLAKPAEPPKQAEKPAEKPAAEPADEESWEHKYKSVNGRYARAQEQIRSLTEQVQNLQNVIATMQATTPTRVESSDEGEEEIVITPEEANDYGEDFLKVVGKKAKAELMPVLKAYKDEIASLKKQLEGVSGFVRQDTQSKLLSKLDADLPDWRTMNTNQQFLDWLSLPDPYSGAIRHDMLKAAYAQGDARRVLAFFKGFLAEEAAVAPAQAEPAQGQKVPKVPLENLAAPGRAKTAASTQAPAEKPFFTRAQIAAFYADAAAGRYAGRDAEKEKLEKQIFDAQREGRIR